MLKPPNDPVPDQEHLSAGAWRAHMLSNRPFYEHDRCVMLKKNVFIEHGEPVMLKPAYKLPPLPPQVDLETIPVLKALNSASRALADLKGQAKTIPNQGILIDTLALQEAKASSEVENIVTTQDELFQADVFPDDPQSPAAKEVARYRDALRLGHHRLHGT